ncbi:hypothetical protein BV11031_00025 [Bacillus vallismortis]|nr:hypothetical protein BV11031_00025 [Bacillus vallismortis]
MTIFSYFTAYSFMNSGDFYGIGNRLLFLDKKRTRITGESVPKKCIHYKKGVNYVINHNRKALHNCYSGIKTQ